MDPEFTEQAPVRQSPHKKIILMLSVLLFGTASAAIYFTFESQKIVGELNRLQVSQDAVGAQATQSTEDWKTYTNTNYNFSIKHPGNWSVTDKPLNDKRSGINTVRVSNGSDAVYISILSDGYGGACASEFQKIRISGQYRDVCVYISESGEKAWEQITFETKNAIFELRGYAKTPADSSSSLIPLIISTFTYENSVQDSQWNVFSSTEYSFSFKYPSRFSRLNELLDDGTYESIGSFFSQKDEETISVSVVKNRTDYTGKPASFVARQEAANSGYAHAITETKIGNSAAAITSYDDSSLGYVVITLAHPRKNTFITITLPTSLSKTEFEELITSFEFSMK